MASVEAMDRLRDLDLALGIHYPGLRDVQAFEVRYARACSLPHTLQSLALMGKPD